MNNLIEARQKLFNSMGEETRSKYILLLRNWFRNNDIQSKIEFNLAIKELFEFDEQFEYHTDYMRSVYEKIIPDNSVQLKLPFERAESSDPLHSTDPPTLLPPTYDKLDAEKCDGVIMPDKKAILAHLEYHLWESSLDGAEDNVSELMVIACQMFVKNILSAMIMKISSYKINTAGFQYGFGLQIPDPLLRNSNNVMDQTKVDQMDVNEEDKEFSLAHQLSRTEQQATFTYVCETPNSTRQKLTLDLLYETLVANPSIVGIHSINSPNLLNIYLQIGEND